MIRAFDYAFQPAAVTAPTGQGLTLYFDNGEALPHNLVVVAADGSRPFSGDVFSGPSQRVYEVTLAPGTYKLHCDVHPNMTGTLTVP